MTAVARRLVEVPASARPSAAAALTAVTESSAATDVVSISITELGSVEETLAHQAHLGDLHPAHARRLAAVTAELDRRWSSHA